jgi:hypothetical protein
MRDSRLARRSIFLSLFVYFFSLGLDCSNSAVVTRGVTLLASSCFSANNINSLASTGTCMLFM